MDPSLNYKAQCIVLAAGDGTRFPKGTHKPLIEFAGSTLIDLTVKFWKSAGAKVTDIIKQDVVDAWTSLESNDFSLPYHMITIEHTQRGPAMSALLAGGGLKDDDFVIIADCDNWLMVDSSKLLDSILASHADAGLVCSTLYDHESTASYCNVWREDDIFVEGIDEKVPYCDTRDVGVGVYWFRRWDLFRRHAMSEFLAKELSKVEIKMSDVLKSILNHEYRVVSAVMVERDQWFNLGTPDELELSWQRLAAINKGV